MHQTSQSGRGLLHTWSKSSTKEVQPRGVVHPLFVQEGVCVTHGAPPLLSTCCRHDGCTNGVTNEGVCITHGARIVWKKCSHERCTNQAKRGWICKKLLNVSCHRSRSRCERGKWNHNNVWLLSYPPSLWWALLAEWLFPSLLISPPPPPPPQTFQSKVWKITTRRKRELVSALTR